MKLQIKRKNTGFTLLELLFVVGIFAILTSVVIYNYGNFNNNIIMSNMAYEVALEIRQAQVYSLGVRGIKTGVDQTFNTRYGLMFQVNGDEEENTSNKHFVIFSDFYPEENNEDVDTPSGNGLCDANLNDMAESPCLVDDCGEYSECVEDVELLRGISFRRICVGEEADGNPVNLVGGECSQPDGEINNVNITFSRPYTNAIIKSHYADLSDSKLNVGIVMQSTGGSQKAVIVRSSGQISVESIDTED